MHVLPGVAEVVCVAVPILSDTSFHPFVLVGIEGAALGSRSLEKGRQLTQGWSFLGSPLPSSVFSANVRILHWVSKLN